MARLVLLKKGNKPEGFPSLYRPICLLDETGKFFERILANRISAFLEERDGLSKYGFRSGRSTIDTIIRLRELVEEGLEDEEEGGIVLTISLDIANAFNSLPWRTIREALVQKDVPDYCIIL